jgi:hypothetical protein
VRKTGDYANGLGLMINGVQYAYLLATHYRYDSTNKTYGIRLRYIFYDVFGLDDIDLRDKGASSDGVMTPYEMVGITAWWQLQHQHGYAPLITRVIGERTFVAPAT